MHNPQGLQRLELLLMMMYGSLVIQGQKHGRSLRFIALHDKIIYEPVSDNRRTFAVSQAAKQDQQSTTS